MITKKETKILTAIYQKARKENQYTTLENLLTAFDMFKTDLKRYERRAKNKQAITLHMKVSSSGMTRHFNFAEHRYNMLFNTLYNNKVSYDPVKVGGCGMDMLWHLLYTACERVMEKKTASNFNGTCSYITKLV